ncbi:hypothetical protein D3C72_1507680 [compost metagenome]
MPQPFADERTRIVFGAHQRQHGHVPGAAVGDRCQVAHQQCIVGCVGLFAAVHLGVARRIHPGRAVQRGHAQSGIVGQRRQPGQAAGMARLGQRVLDEGDVRLFGLGHAQFALGHQFDAQGREQGGKLAQLAGVVGRQDDTAQGIGNLGGSHSANCIGPGRRQAIRPALLACVHGHDKSLLTLL